MNKNNSSYNFSNIGTFFWDAALFIDNLMILEQEKVGLPRSEYNFKG